MDDTSLCFLNCHLAAGHRRVRDRNADAAAIIEHEKLFPEPETLGETSAFVGGGDGTMALDHEIVFVSSPEVRGQARIYTYTDERRPELPN
jgi:hypothetical protein